MPELEVGTVESRRGVYHLLRRIFEKESDEKLLADLEASGLRRELEDRGFDLGLPLGPIEPGTAERLAVEYTRLFIGPGDHAPLFASVHSDRVGDKGRLWGDSTVEVKKFIESTGLMFKPGRGSVPDHLAIELEFMARLVEAEEEATREGNEDAVRKIASAQQRFLSEYLLSWFPSFARKVAESKPHPFYASLTKFCHEWLLSEKGALAGSTGS
ncbi:MAG: molecular chaperone TorD family protein [Planctomycetes bacterium]|nr:molecular chaperone TorD family protein [Planctomycetota bacterium]